MRAKAKVLIIDDERLIRWSISEKLGDAGFAASTAESGRDGLERFDEEPSEVVLLDIRLPDMDGVEVLRRLREREPAVQVIMVTACDTVEDAIRSFKLGAFDYIIKPFDLEEITAVVEKALETARLRSEVGRMRKHQRRRFSLDRIIGESAAIREVIDTTVKVAASDASTVFLLGESGTGKDLLARAIHYGGARASRPFMEINCAALPDLLLESELFGHERGAFTDARSAKQGLLEMADGGTVFLDEIGDMKPGLQSKILHVIEQRTFRRVGGVRDTSVDIRIIAATNRDLDAAVRDGQFREDLYYRLKVLPIHLPALRDRQEDVLPLVMHFMAHFNRLYKQKLRGVGGRARRLLEAYDWPGNVRELKNVVERAIILGAEDEISAESLPPEIRHRWARPAQFRYRLPPEGLDLAEIEADFLRQALLMAGNNQTRAAKLLRLSRDALRYRLKKFGIRADTDEIA